MTYTHEQRIHQLETALKFAIAELRQWNPDSEAAAELERQLADSLDVRFEMLANALAYVRLRTSKPPYQPRQADASEFMYMSEDANEYAFKHWYTRNYVYICKRTGKIRVPVTDKPWLRGYFDAAPDIGYGLPPTTPRKKPKHREETTYRGTASLAYFVREHGEVISPVAGKEYSFTDPTTGETHSGYWNGVREVRDGVAFLRIISPTKEYMVSIDKLSEV